MMNVEKIEKERTIVLYICLLGYFIVDDDDDVIVVQASQDIIGYYMIGFAWYAIMHVVGERRAWERCRNWIAKLDHHIIILYISDLKMR
jgi:hypothetical protein